MGSLGTYGDLFDLFGLQSKDTLPGEEAQRTQEFDILEKMQQPGYVPSIGELDTLSEQEPIPRYSRLPTSGKVGEIIEELGGPGEAKTTAGRYSKRIGQIGGSSLATGAPGVKASFAAGAAGQTVEELGGPPWLQAAAEIVSFLKYSPKSANQITAKSPEINDFMKNLRKMGYSEEDITLAKNSLEDKGILKKWSKMTPEAEKSIDNALSKSEDLFKKQIQKGLPGLEKGGREFLKKEADNLYQVMEQVAETVPLKNTTPLEKSIQKSIDYLENHALLPEQRSTVEFLKEALEKLTNNKNISEKTLIANKNIKNADYLTEMYRNMNRAGKWLNPKQKEHLLRETKQAIVETFKANGESGKKFANYFEKTNKGWQKWIDAEESLNILEKAETSSGTDWKKLGKILEDSQNVESLEKTFGKEIINNFTTIKKGAESFKDLEKILNKGGEKGLLSGYKALETAKGLYNGIVNGDWSTLAALTSFDLSQKISTKLLTDKNYQNIMKKMIKASAEKSPTLFAFWSQKLIELAEKEESNPSDQSKKDQKEAKKT